MARNLRQSKILELISSKEVQTQDELVSFLKSSGFDVTQATISRDIKELGMLKVLSSDSKSYKYAVVENNDQPVVFKHINILKELILNVKFAENLCVIKTIKGMASSVCNMMDKLMIENLLGSVFGDDTVMLIFPSKIMAEVAANNLSNTLTGIVQDNI